MVPNFLYVVLLLFHIPIKSGLPIILTLTHFLLGRWLQLHLFFHLF